METEYVDVLVVGAGLSGIGAGYHLQTLSPDRTYLIVEGRDDIGGTWDLFRYPGVRSDSDMHTLGFNFKPWKATKAIADGPSIMAYLRETITEYGIDHHIRFGHLVTKAEWSSELAHWSVTLQRRDTGTSTTITCGFLFMCSGYYSYRSGYTPDFPDLDRFAGTVLHPQEWPEDLDDTGKRVVVIGSGATAMTLVPAMALTAEHVTMLQRSPTYVVSRPDQDGIANALGKVLPDRWAYAATRWKNTTLQQVMYRRTRSHPEQVKKRLIDMVRKELGSDYDVERHFTPSYNPWDQRLCLLPNSDLFKAIRSGRASVVTDEIVRFTETGIELASGDMLEADIVVTATGLSLVTLGEVAFVVDGQPVDFSTTWSYKGFAYSDVPNLASSFGYINASWTLRSDLIGEYVCRLLNHLRDTGTVQCTPRLRPADRNMPERRWIEDFSARYMERAMHLFPKQGDREPWINPQNYRSDKKMFRSSPVEDGVMRFTPRGATRRDVERHRRSGAADGTPPATGATLPA